MPGLPSDGRPAKGWSQARPVRPLEPVAGTGGRGSVLAGEEPAPRYVWWQIGIAALGVIMTGIGIYVNRRRR